MQIAYETLRILSDGKFHSGTLLANSLKVSRSSIWKGIAYLRDLGVCIQAVSGRGYRWATPMELLNKKMILQSLSESALVFWQQIDLVNVVTSTNDYLIQRLPYGMTSASACIAEAQTAGKGRMGKKWQSPFGNNIYMSVYWRFASRLNDLSGLSLIAGLSVIQALKEIYPIPKGLGVKWPNDIWFGDQKLCGILIETVGGGINSTSDHTDVVIGIGINVNMPSSIEVNTAWTDLNHILGYIPSRNRIVANILNVLTFMLDKFTQKGFSAFISEWEENDLLLGKEIQLSSAHGNQIGVAKGVNERGELCVLVDKTLKAIRYGEVSVRAHPAP